MRQRKTHAISRSRSEAQPRRLVGLAVDAASVVADDAPSVALERLTGWASAGWSVETDGSRRQWAGAGGDVAAWWQSAQWALRRPGMTWVVCYRAIRVLSLLGAWERVERGEVWWSGKEHGRPDGRGSGGLVPQVQGRARAAGAFLSRAMDDALSKVRRSGVPGCGDGARGRTRGPGGHQYLSLDDPPTCIDLRAPGRCGTLRIVDIRNYGIVPPVSLAAAASLAQWLADTMWRMVRCLKSHGWGGLQRTAASQAMTTWRRSYLTHRVIAHDDADILALEGRAYYGGRCEAGKIGKVPGPVAVCDVRSMYPWVCASMHLPVAVQAQGEGSVPVVPGRAMPGRDCLAEVLVETAEPWYPTRTKAGVLYPVGRLRTVLAGPELALAIASGHVRQVGRWVQYHMAPALAAYASAVYQVREEMERDGLPQLAQWIKALLVALPGKLGQRDRRWVDEQRRSPWGPWAAWVQAHEELGVRRCRALAGRVQVQHTDGYSWDAVPAMAAWILSAARVRLLDGLRAVGWSHALYWDTDAIICPESRVDRLLPSGGTAEGSLGVWQVRERARSVWVHGPKHYEIGGRRVCAGLPPAACRCDTRADHYWYQQTMAQALIEHRAPLAQRRLLPFGRDEAYRLGRVGPDGRVHPFLAEDW